MGANGRKPRPATLRLIEGRAPGRDSGGRVVKPPPGFKRLPPEKPDDLGEPASKLWDQIVEEFQRLNIIKELDGAALEVFCRTFGRYREAVEMRHQHGLLAERRGLEDVKAGVWIGIEERAGKELRLMASEFGLTPAAEARLAKEAATGSGEDNNALFNQQQG